MTGQPSNPSAILRFLEYLQQNQSEYYAKCKEAASKIKEEFGIGLDSTHLVFSAPMRASANPEDYKLDVIDSNTAIRVWDEYQTTNDLKLLYKFMASEADATRAGSARRVARSFANVKSHIDSFFLHTGIFGNLGDTHIEYEELNSQTQTLLAAIAPDTPTIDDTFVLTTIKNTKSGLTVLAIKAETGSEATPLFFEKESNSDLAKSGERHTVHVTNFPVMKSDGAHGTPNGGLLMSTGDSTHYRIFSYGVGYSAYVHKTIEIARQSQSVQLFDVEKMSFFSHSDSDCFPVSSKVFNRVEKHNTLWCKHHSAKLEWEYLDGYTGTGDPANDWVELRFMADLVLLDMSRFGWAPCWSTPENTPTTPEDGNADTFINDLSEFKPVSSHSLSGRRSNRDRENSDFLKYKSVSAQTNSQWECTKFMHSTTFRRLRRRQYLRSVLGIANDSLMLKSFAIDPDFEAWANAIDESHESHETQRSKEMFLSSIQKYTKDVGNDIPVLCVCFTATQIRLREGLLRPFRDTEVAVNQAIRRWISENLLSGTTFQIMDAIRRFKFLAFKAISVPAHETLKRPVVGWMEDCTKIGTFLENRMCTTALEVEKVADDRKELVNAFILHATDKTVRTSSNAAQTPGSVSLISTGLPCAAAVYSYDAPCLCARVRIRLPNKTDRDKVLGELKELKPSDGASLLEEWKKIQRLSGEYKNNFFVSKKNEMQRFVELYYKTSVTVSKTDNGKDSEIAKRNKTKELFEKIYQEWQDQGFPNVWMNLINRNIQEFVCDSALNRVLSEDENCALSDVFSQLRKAKRKQSVGRQGISPLVFADPELDTDIFMVAEIDISRISKKLSTGVYVPADVEVDQVVHRLQRSCPLHRKPSEGVQNAFSETSKERLVVTRLDWWVGSATPGEVESYKKAVAVVPVVPYRFVNAQLNKHDELSSDISLTNTAITPFQNASSVVASMREAMQGVKVTLSQFSENESRLAYESSSVLTQVFSDEQFLGLSPMQSLGRVCRIAFELLKGNVSYKDENDGHWKPTSYDRISHGYVRGEKTFASGMDYLAWQYLNTPSRMGAKRANHADATHHLDVLLVPYQHQPVQQVNEVRSFDVTYSETDLLSYPEHAIGVFRMLQLRVSNASYAMKDLRMVYQNADSLTLHRLNFELASQEAACYSTPFSERVESDETRKSALLVAENLFPKAFEVGRRSDDTTNNMDPRDIADATALKEYRKMASLYMATTVTNLKAVQLDLRPAQHPTDCPMLRQIMSEMASIAEGIRYARPFLRLMASASNILMRASSNKYRHTKTVTRILTSNTQPMLEEFASNHAKFEDGIRSYADMASIGVSDVESLKRRFLDAYDTVRAFRRGYDRGAQGLLLYLTNEFCQAALTRKLEEETSTIVKTLFASMERMMTSNAFVESRRQIEERLDLETTLRSMFPSMEAYTILAARVHVNGMLGCATSAAPFRDVYSQENDPEHQRAIRESKGFDTMGGFLDSKERKFHAILPTAKDVFSDGLSESDRNDPASVTPPTNDPASVTPPTKEVGTDLTEEPDVFPENNDDDVFTFNDHDEQTWEGNGPGSADLY